MSCKRIICLAGYGFNISRLFKSAMYYTIIWRLFPTSLTRYYNLLGATANYKPTFIGSPVIQVKEDVPIGEYAAFRSQFISRIFIRIWMCSTASTVITLTFYHITSHRIVSHHILAHHIISYHISYHIISYHIISYIISYHISYHIRSDHIISYHVISYHISYRIMSCHVMSYHIISYHISYRIMSCHIISYLIISYHIILCHVISCLFARSDWFIKCFIS